MRKGLVGILVGVGLLSAQAVTASEMVRYEPLQVAANTSTQATEASQSTTVKKVSHTTADKAHKKHARKKHRHQVHDHGHGAHYHHRGHHHHRGHPHNDEFDRKKHHVNHHTEGYSKLPRSKRVLEHIEEELPMNELAPDHH